MDLRVLGHLRVEVDDLPVAVPPGKATALLLRLLADVGHPVTVDSLIDAMWPTSPPRDARAALQVRVSQLRRVLEPGLDRPADSTVIVSEGDAYLVPADGRHVVDARRFVELVDEARRAARAARTAEAVDLLGDALGLWSGDVPFAESGALWATEVRAPLVELRQQAREERAALVLAAGGTLVEVIADLERLCAEEPLRERGHELLIRTLYRCGRQAEALAVYNALRDRLVDELGIDPTPALQELHRQVLVQDPGLDAPSQPAAPRPLPAPLTGFVDAGGRIERSRQLLGAARLVTLTGPGGTGKTRLALETARRMTDTLVWFVDLTAVPRPDGIAEAVATALRATPATPDMLARTPAGTHHPLVRIVERVADHDALLVLDNCEHVLEGAAEVARRLLGDCAGLRVLATSRQALGIPGEAVWSLPQLGVPPPGVTGADVLTYPAIELLVDRLRASDPTDDVAAADAELLAEIARRLDGIPLALELVAARARSLSLAAIVRRLDNHLALATGGHGIPERHRTLTAVVDWSWQLLDDRQRATATTCAVFLDAFDTDDVLAVDPTLGDRAAAEEVLLELVDRSLLVVDPAGPDGEPTFSTLVTIREVARQHLRARGDMAAVEAALVRRCVEVVAAAQPRLRGPQRHTTLAELDRRAADLTAALDRAIAAGDRTSALSLSSGLGWWWIHRRRSEGAARLVEALACAGHADPQLEADAYRWAAFVGQGTLPWPEVVELAQAALERCERVGHELGSGLTSLILATSAQHTERYDQARLHAAEAVEVFDRLGDRWGLATAMIIGVDVDLHDPDSPDDGPELLDRIDRADALFAALDDGWGLVHTASRRAEWFERSGQPSKAAAEQRSAQQKAARIGLDLAQA